MQPTATTVLTVVTEDSGESGDRALARWPGAANVHTIVTDPALRPP
jgi:hypothetical protein